MKKGLMALIIILGVILGTVIGNFVSAAALPGLEQAEGGKVYYNGSEYSHLNSDAFTVEPVGRPIGRLTETWELVYRAKGDEEGYFLYIREIPFNLKRLPLVRADAARAFAEGIERLELNSIDGKDIAAAIDERVINDLTQAYFSTGEPWQETQTVEKLLYVKAYSPAFPDETMRFQIQKRSDGYWVKVQPTSYEDGDRYAKLGETASDWIRNAEE